LCREVISDDAWAVIGPLFPQAEPTGRHANQDALRKDFAGCRREAGLASREVDLGWRVSCDRPAVPAAKNDRATSGSTAHGGGGHRVALSDGRGGQAADAVMLQKTLERAQAAARHRRAQTRPPAATTSPTAAATSPGATVHGSWH
jgi:hypothetical protein